MSLAGDTGASNVARRWLVLAIVFIAAAHLWIASHAPLANDAKMQWAQIVAGRLNDWHPPAMARLWQALGMFGSGPLPFTVFAVLLYWAGFLAIGIAFLRAGRPGLAPVPVAVGLFAAVLWFEAISKDTLLTAFFVLGFGLALNARLGPQPRGRLLVGAIVLIVIGVLMRHNGAFAAGPAILLAVAPRILRRFWLGAGLSVAIAAMLVPASQVADRYLFDAVPSRVEDALMLFDLTGIAYHADDESVFGTPGPITKRDVAQCYSPVMWDTMAPWGICPWFPAKAGAKLLDQSEMIAGQVPPASDFKSRWLAAVARHPLAYLTHRVRHLNAELLLLVSIKPRNGIVPADPGQVERDSVPLTIARYTAGVVFIPAVVVAVCLVSFMVLFARLGTSNVGAPLIEGAYAMSCSALLYAGSYAVLGVATAPRYYMLTGVLSLIALAVGLSDEGARRILRQRPMLRLACFALPLGAVAIAEVGRIFVPVPPPKPLIAAS